MKRKGASPVIAALLLIGIAVASVVVAYTWTMSMVKQQGSQAQTSIRIDEVLYGNATSGTDFAVKVSVRNTGSVPTVIESIYIYKGDAQIVQSIGIDYTVEEKGLISVSLEEDTGYSFSEYYPSLGGDPDSRKQASFGTDLVTSSGYKIRVVSDNGFVVEGAYYSPSTFQGN